MLPSLTPWLPKDHRSSLRSLTTGELSLIAMLGIWLNLKLGNCGTPPTPLVVVLTEPCSALGVPSTSSAVVKGASETMP